MALILVIDDSAYMRSKISDFLRKEDHDVLEAGDGMAGLKMAYSRRPDCVILDIIMPEIDGIKILKTLHGQGSPTPVIVVTADIQTSVRKQCLALGAAALLNKPPQERELLNAIREVLSTRRKGAPVRQATPYHLDALKEFINIGVGRAAASLSEMVRQRVNLDVPSARILTALQFKAEMDDFGSSKTSSIKIGFDGPFYGSAALVFSSESASRLVRALADQPAGLSTAEAEEETLKEIGNIVINGVLGSIANMLKQRFSYTLPAFAAVSVKDLFLSERIGNDTVFLLVRTRFRVREVEVEGNIILLFTVGAFDMLLSVLDELK